MSDKLPSLDDLLEESKLPSIDDFIKEEDLPSVDEFIEEQVLEEKKECGEGEYFCNDEQKCKSIPAGHKVLEDGELVKEDVDLTEIVRLINDVRKDIPDVPEVKYYDEELEKLAIYVEEIKESIPEIPEQKTYDAEVEAICEQIDSLKEEVDKNAADIPEIKYYDEQISELENRLNKLPELPEVRYYEEDIKSLQEDILAVKESIPKFPKWVNEVNEVPDFSWIGKTFSVIDDDFIKLNDNLDFVKGRIDQEVQQLSEDIGIKRFESKTDIDELTKNLKETKDKIYKELRESALKIYDAKNGYKDDDRKLKKQLLNQFHVLKQNITDEVKEFNRKNDATSDLYGGYFEGLTQEISNLPEVKYYDEEIKEVRDEFKEGLKSLKTLVEEIKEKQQAVKSEVQDIQEGLLNEPPDEKQSVGSGADPLAPLDKQFPSLKALADHYRLFINRTQQQIATIGGGGAGYMKDLADVNIDATPDTGNLLIYNGSEWVGIGSTLIQGSTDLDSVLEGGNVSGIGMSVGVITATNGYFSGIVTASTINYDNVTDIYSTGIVTATKGIQVTGLGVHVTTAGVSTFVGLTSFRNGINVISGTASTALIVQGDARITGILTIGTGSVTINGSDNKVQIGTGVTLTSTGEADFVGVVTANGFEVAGLATISSNGNMTVSGIITGANFKTGVSNVHSTGYNVGSAITMQSNGNIAASGIVTASKYYGDGSSLSNVTSTTINNNADNRLITGSGTANTLEGESTLTYDGAKLSVSTGSTIFTNGNIAASGIVTCNGGFVGGLTGNVTGNASGSSGSCTGNAATATILATARNIGGVSFDGSAAINLPGVNASGSQNTSGTAAGLTGTPNITVGDVVAASLDISGDADIDGTLEADAYTVNGTALDTHIAGVTVTNATNASIATNVTAADESSDTTCFPLFVTAATGNLPPKTGSNLAFNSANGTLTASIFSGSGASLTNIPGVASESDTAVSSTSATTVATIDKTAQRAAFIDVVITQSSAYQAGRYGLIHDGTTVTIVEQFAIATGSMLGTFSGTISGDNMLLQVTMGSSSSATVTVKTNTITV